MVELHIKIRKRIARLAYGENFVSYNEGYKIIFDFDKEWDSIGNKIARFIFGENYIDCPINGNEVEIPLIKNADTLEIGVYSDNLYTTTAVKFKVLKSIKDEEKIEILVPEAYPEIEELDDEDLIRVYDKSEEKIGISPLKKLFDKMGVAINTALAAAKASGEFDGADGITPTIGENGNWYLGSTDTGKPSRGEKGEKGETGAQGEKGATGATGADGKSAYSYAQDGGYTGTEAEFAAKLAAESIDKALYVINATIDFDSFELSVDKTFEEIKQAYDEGKYSIVLSLMGASTAPLIGMTSEVCIFARVSATQQDIVSVTVDTVKITKDNVIETYSADLTTTDSTLPNPYPLTFTGAVNETYDGSSAKTIEIPSGGGGSAWHTIGTQKMDGVETAVSFDLNGETIIQIIVTANWGEALTATKATVSLNLENGTTVDFTPQTMNASSYSPKNIFTIFGNSKQCRQMIFSKAEGAVYSSVQGSFGVAYGYDYSSEHMVEDKIATGITITFDKAPSNAAVVKVEGM